MVQSKSAKPRQKTSGIPLLKIRWRTMIARCNHPQQISYPDYGGKGVTVCDRWMSFESFYQDMGNPPFPSATIERQDNNLGYSPDNCCWATPQAQARNRKSSKPTELFGVCLFMWDWSELSGLSSDTIQTRLQLGKRPWKLINAVFTPKMAAHQLCSSLRFSDWLCKHFFDFTTLELNRDHLFSFYSAALETSPDGNLKADSLLQENPVFHRFLYIYKITFLTLLTECEQAIDTLFL